MPQPETGPTTDVLVKAYLSMDPDAESADVTAAVLATNEHVRGLAVSQYVDGDVWPSYITLGCTMLAGRLVRRKNSPSGTIVMGDVFAYVQRADPDVAMLLQLGPYAKPSVG